MSDIQQEYLTLLDAYSKLHREHLNNNYLDIFNHISSIDILEGEEACFRTLHSALKYNHIKDVVWITYSSPMPLSKEEPIVIGNTVPEEIIGYSPITLSDIEIYSGDVFTLTKNNLEYKVVPCLIDKGLVSVMIHPPINQQVDNMLLVLFNIISKSSNIIDERGRKVLNMKESLFTDLLMSIPNSSQLKHDQTTYSPLHVAFTDIDFFKSINDTYGHPFGDLVLSGYGKILYELSNRNVVPYRVGGDEIVILSNDETMLMDFLNKLVERLNSTPFIFNDKEIYITLSIGVCLYADNYANGLEVADTNIYIVKNANKNGIKVSKYKKAEVGGNK